MGELRTTRAAQATASPPRLRGSRKPVGLSVSEGRRVMGELPSHPCSAGRGVTAAATRIVDACRPERERGLACYGRAPNDSACSGHGVTAAATRIAEACRPERERGQACHGRAPDDSGNAGHGVTAAPNREFDVTGPASVFAAGPAGGRHHSIEPGREGVFPVRAPTSCPFPFVPPGW